MQVNILEAKNRLSQLIKWARAGEEIVIANRGEPVARLIPAEIAKIPTAAEGSARTILDWLNAHPLPVHAQRPIEEIDAGIAEEKAGWD